MFAAKSTVHSTRLVRDRPLRAAAHDLMTPTFTYRPEKHRVYGITSSSRYFWFALR